MATFRALVLSLAATAVLVSPGLAQPFTVRSSWNQSLPSDP